MAEQPVWLMPGYPTQWGEPEQVYRQQKSWLPRAMKIAGSLMFLLLTFLVPYAAYRSFARSTLDPDYFCLGSAFALQILLVVCMAVPILKQIKADASQRDDIAVRCAAGVAYFHNGIWSCAKWDEIAEAAILSHASGKALAKEALGGDIFGPLLLGLGLTWILFGGDRRTYVITTYAGDQIKLGETLADIDKLVGTIQCRIEPLLLASARQVLESGRAVKFGPVTITREWLNYGGKNMAWDTIECIEDEPEKTSIDQALRIQRSYLYFPVEIPKQDVPNAQVLLTAAEEMICLAKRSEAQKV